MVEYPCVVEYMSKRAEGNIRLDENELIFCSPFEEFAVPYCEINSFTVENYRLHIKTEAGDMVASMLGSFLTPLNLKLEEKYIGMTEKAFFIEKAHVFEARGGFFYADRQETREGNALVRVYDRCAAILPPDDGARRIPLCFLRSVERDGYRHRLTLDTGEHYDILKLGRDTTPFENHINKAIMDMRRKTAEAVLRADQSLGEAAAAKIAVLSPEGTAARVNELEAVGASYIKAAGGYIGESRAAQTYDYFMKTLSQDSLYLGMREETTEDQTKPVYHIVACFNKDSGGIAALEHALYGEEAAATYLFRYNGASDDFVAGLNRAVEAVSFKREAVALTDNQLAESGKEHYKAAYRRTPALRYLRAHFLGKIIHTSFDSWKQKLNEALK